MWRPGPRQGAGIGERSCFFEKGQVSGVGQLTVLLLEHAVAPELGIRPLELRHRNALTAQTGRRDRDDQGGHRLGLRRGIGQALVDQLATGKAQLLESGRSEALAGPPRHRRGTRYLSPARGREGPGTRAATVSAGSTKLLQNPTRKLHAMNIFLGGKHIKSDRPTVTRLWDSNISSPHGRAGPERGG